MFNGGSRKRLASPLPTRAKSGRVMGDTAAPGGTDRRDEESVGRAKRQRVVEDVERVVTASAVAANRSSNCVPHPPGFYLQPSYPALPGPGTGTGSSSQLQHHQLYTHPSAPFPPSASIQSSSTACVPYYDVIKMQMLAAAAATGDVWKARAAAAAAAAAAVTGVCPITPPINVIWPPATPPADFLSAVGRPRNPLEQFLAMSPSNVGQYRQLNNQRTLAAFDDVKQLRNGHRRQGRSTPPLPAEARKSFSAFRLVSDVDDPPTLGAGPSSLPLIDCDNDAIDVMNDDDINNLDDDNRQRLDGNANHCDGNDVAPLRDDKLNKIESHGLVDSDFINQQQTTNEVVAATRLSLYHNCHSTMIRLRYDYDEKLTCSFFCLRRIGSKRAIRRSRIVSS